MNFTYRDKVRITASKHGHCFPIGAVVTIKNLYPNDECYLAQDMSVPHGDEYYVEDDEIEAVEPTPEVKAETDLRAKFASYLTELANHVDESDAADLPKFLRVLGERVAKGEIV
jgi:hypothetical protein